MTLFPAEACEPALVREVSMSSQKDPVGMRIVMRGIYKMPATVYNRNAPYEDNILHNRSDDDWAGVAYDEKAKLLGSRFAIRKRRTFTGGAFHLVMPAK